MSGCFFRIFSVNFFSIYLQSLPCASVWDCVLPLRHWTGCFRNLFSWWNREGEMKYMNYMLSRACERQSYVSPIPMLYPSHMSRFICADYQPSLGPFPSHSYVAAYDIEFRNPCIFIITLLAIHHSILQDTGRRIGRDNTSHVTFDIYAFYSIISSLTDLDLMTSRCTRLLAGWGLFVLKMLILFLHFMLETI